MLIIFCCILWTGCDEELPEIDSNQQIINYSITTNDVSDVGIFSAVLHAKINIPLRDEYTIGFQLSTDSLFPGELTHLCLADSIASDSSFSFSIVRGVGYDVDMPSLEPGTQYFVRSFINLGEIGYVGNLKSFNTIPVEIITGVLDSVSNGINCKVNILTYDSWIGGFLGVCYGAAPEPTINDYTVSIANTDMDLQEDGTFFVDVNQLLNEYGGNFYYRAYYSYNGKSYYGETRLAFMPYKVVDMGLSVNWAICNVGASKPEDYGNYYAWGETEPKNEYDWFTYRWCNSRKDYLTKYNISNNYGSIDNKITLDLEDDVAHVILGGSWRMPTKAEQDELITSCTWTWYDSDNSEFGGVAGYKVTSNKEGYTDCSIFLPAAGFHYGTDIYNVGLFDSYWSSSLCTDDTDNAWRMGGNTSYGSTNGFGRNSGLSVRPVCPSEDWLSCVSISFFEDNKILWVNRSVTLNAIVKHNDEILDAPAVTWFSDNPSVAYVDQTGTVTAKSTGTAHIVASIQSVSSQCTITVVEDESKVEHEFVDLGLSVKWATFNVGASSPMDLGETYMWYNGSTSTSKYYVSYNNGNAIYNKIILDSEDDIAHVKWGGSWCMPTRAEQDELITNCTWTWFGSDNSEFGGVAGYKVTSNIEGYTDRFIFLPAAGYRDGTILRDVGGRGYYWSSSFCSSNYAYSLHFNSGGSSTYENNRYYGLSIRPVCASEEWLSLASISVVADNNKLLVGNAAMINVIIKQNDEILSAPPVTVVWSSDNPSVADVDSKGTVIAKSTGIAHITASIQSSSLFDECTITVVDDELEIVHEYVDLGLSVKWATFNVGATSPWNYGAYYAWGEIETKTYYSTSNYKLMTEKGDSITKYNTQSSFGIVDNKTTLDLEDDVAHVKWGGSWRMPTWEELDELCNNCIWSLTSINNIGGYLVIGKKEGYTDHSIFLPIAGYYEYGLCDDVRYGYYWSSSLYLDYPDYTYNAWFLRFGSGFHYSNSGRNRCIGLSVRPVCP